MVSRHDDQGGDQGAEPTKIWQQYSKLTIVLNFINKYVPRQTHQ